MPIEREYRNLTAIEEALLERLLSARFQGCDALRAKIGTFRVRQIDDEGSLQFEPLAQSVPVSVRVPVEAEGRDADGTTVHILLHVVSGSRLELEIFKDDGSKIQEMPEPQNLTLFTP